MSYRSGAMSMFGTSQQIPLQGSIITAYTMISEEGNIVAKALIARNICERLEEKNNESSFLQVTDSLNPNNLTKRIMTSVNSIPGLGASLETVDDIHARYEYLRHIELGNATSDVHAVYNCITNVLNEHYNELRESLFRVYDNCPSMVSDAIAAVRHKLQGLSGCKEELKHLTKLRRMVKTLHELALYEGEIPGKTLERTKRSLLQEARLDADRSLAEIVQRKVYRAIEKRNVQFEDTFKDLEYKAYIYQQRVADIYDYFAEREKQVSRNDAERMSMACLSLPGPDKEQVLSGIKAALSCSDLTEVTNVLVSDFEARLREYGKKTCPYIIAGSASIPTLMLEIGAEDLGKLINDMVEDNLGHGHSPYQIIETYGIERVAKCLHEKAAPTCSFSGRDCETLGVSIDEITIARLPKARTPSDEKILTRMKDHLKKNPKCHLTEGGESEKEILLTRVQGGWPIGIENANSALHMAYVESGERGHVPHLLYLLPDSPLGCTIPAINQYLDLSKQPKEENNEQ